MSLVLCVGHQLTSVMLQATAYSNVEDIEVLGAVVYTGPDNEGYKGAAFFEGSGRAHFTVDNLGVPAKNVLDMLET